MKIRYIGKTMPMAFVPGKIYELIGFEKGPDLISGNGDVDWARIIDETGEDYLYLFEKGKQYEIVEE